MKTKFFKKLSFVLVVAMVLSLLVPAAGAFAAAAPKLNSTKKYLHLGRDDANEFNFNINNKQKGWQYYWESANEEVAVVNEKNGVTTATGVGKTKITVDITDADDEEVATLTATVTVRDNIEEVTIKNPVEKLAVGAEHDYNRSFVTEAGSTKKTSAITRWTVDPAETASIDDKGVFVATEAGEYKVTALSFQSLERYNNWLDDSEAYAGEVLDTDETTVVVTGSMLEAKQTELDKVAVYFDSAVEDADKNITISQMVGTTPVKQLVKEVKLSDDKKVATVTMYIPFAAEATYKVDYTDMDSVSFVAATTKAEDVASMQITTSTAVLNQAKKVDVKLFNLAGVNITTTELTNRVTMTSSNGLGTFFNPATKEVTVFTKDATTTITAKYHTYKYDNMGNEIGTIEVAGVIVGVETDSTNVTGLKAWTIVDNTASPDFDDVKQILAVGDSAKKLFVKYNTLTGTTEGSVENTGGTAGDFEFTSSDSNVLIVDALGNLYPVKEGSVVVVVSYGAGGSTKSPIGAVAITVSPKRAAGSFTLSTNSVTLSNTTNFVDSATVKLSVKDNLGADFTYANYKVEKMTGSPDDTTTPANTTLTPVGSTLTGDIVFTGSGKTAGTYYYKVTVADKVAVVTVIVQNATGTVTSHKIEVGSSSVDLMAENGKEDKDVTIKLVGRNSSGVVITNETIDGANYVLEIEAPETDWNYPANATFNPATNKYKLATGVTGSAIDKAPTGSYKVTAKVLQSGVLVPVDIVYFSVIDSQPAPVLAEVKTRLFSQTIADVTVKTDAQLIAAAQAALKITLEGTDVTADIIEVDAFGNPSEFNIRSVKVRQIFTNGYIDHTVNIGLTITKN